MVPIIQKFTLVWLPGKRNLRSLTFRPSLSFLFSLLSLFHSSSFLPLIHSFHSSFHPFPSLLFSLSSLSSFLPFPPRSLPSLVPFPPSFPLPPPSLSNAGTMYSWGSATNNALGHGDEEDKEEPEVVKSKQLETRQVVAVSVGGQHSAIIAVANNNNDD